MVIYLGADHRGFELKEHLKKMLLDSAYEVSDLGNRAVDPDDDYALFAMEVGRSVSMNNGSRGILVCGSGAGVDIVANKMKGIRSVLGFATDQVYAARHDDDANVLSLSSEFTSAEDAEKIVKIFLATPFGNEERYVRRLEEIKKLENGA